MAGYLCIQLWALPPPSLTSSPSDSDPQPSPGLHTRLQEGGREGRDLQNLD